MKPFQAWLLLDAEGTYSPHMHMTRKEAEADKRAFNYLRDARWRVVRVLVRRVDRTVKRD